MSRIGKGMESFVKSAMDKVASAYAGDGSGGYKMRMPTAASAQGRQPIVLANRVKGKGGAIAGGLLAAGAAGGLGYLMGNRDQKQDKKKKR